MSDPYTRSLLGESEEILLVTRQHPFLLIQSMGWEIVSTIVIVVAVTAVLVLVPPLQLLAPLGYLLLLIPLIGVIVDIIVWNNRKYIVTNRRVLQISGVYNKNVTDSSLEKVNDVKMVQSFLGRMFDYGDVEILTASELGVNLLRMISSPIRFKTAMLNAKEEMAYDDAPRRPAMRGEPEEVSPGEVPDMIARLDQLRQQGILSEEEFRAKKTELLRKIE